MCAEAGGGGGFSSCRSVREIYQSRSQVSRQHGRRRGAATPRCTQVHLYGRTVKKALAAFGIKLKNTEEWQPLVVVGRQRGGHMCEAGHTGRQANPARVAVQGYSTVSGTTTAIPCAEYIS